MTSRIGFRLRLSFPGQHPMGPGKAELMALIREHGSISAAGAAMDMSYRRAWLLVDELNAMFREPVIIKSQGGAKGGGAALSPFGEALLSRYQAMEKKAEDAMADDLAWLERNLSTDGKA